MKISDRIEIKHHKSEGRVIATITTTTADGYSCMVEGVATLSPKDSWNPKIGRYTAMKKALKQVPKAERRGLWLEYIEVFPNDKPGLWVNLLPEDNAVAGLNITPMFLG